MTKAQAIYLLKSWDVAADETMTMEELNALVEKGKPRMSTLELDPEFGATLRAAREREEREEHDRIAAKAGVVKEVIAHIQEALDVTNELINAKDIESCNVACQKLKNCFDEALGRASVVCIHVP